MFAEVWKTKPRLCLAAWIAIVVGLCGIGFWTGMQTSLPGPTAKEAILRSRGEQLAYQHGIPPKDVVFFVLSSQALPTSDARFVETTESLWAHLKGLLDSGGSEKVFEKVQTIGHSWIDDSMFSSEDGHNLLIIAESATSLDHSTEALRKLPDQLSSWQHSNPEFQLNYLSSGTSDNEIFSLINRDLDRSLKYSLPATFLILIWSFGSVVAALVPLIIAAMSLLASLAVAAIISSLFGPVSATAAQLVVLLVLAIGVDYSLFIISRLREERARGIPLLEAIALTKSAAGTMVMWSGLTVALSLLGLLVMGDTVLTSMGIVSIVAVLITVASAVWALPPLLLLLGDTLEKGVLIRRRQREAPRMNRVAHFSTHNPRTALLAGLVVMLVPALALTYIKLGTSIEAANFPPAMQAHQAYNQLSKHFPNLSGVSFSLILSGKGLGELEDSGEIEAALDSLKATFPFQGPMKIDRSADGTISRYHFIASGSANDELNRSLIASLRTSLSHKFMEAYDVEVYSAGVLPFAVEEVARYQNRLVLVVGVVLGVSLLVLLFAFRSLVLPIHAIILNLLSTATSFGVLVICFQFSGIDAWNYGVIESFVPPLLFSILFGLSIDYHVFVVSRIQEEYSDGHSMTSAVERGVSATYRTITCAALIMVSVFAIIATLELPVMKQLGVGLAVAVFLDATVVRSIVLPSSLVLLGKSGWYLPSFLSWIPKAQHR